MNKEKQKQLLLETDSQFPDYSVEFGKRKAFLKFIAEKATSLPNGGFKFLKVKKLGVHDC